MRHRKALFAVGVAVCAGIAGAVPGDPLGGEFRANTRTAGFQGTPAVSMALDGRFAAAWVGDSAEGWIVWGRQFNASGTPLDNEIGERGIGYPPDMSSFPAVTMSKYGYTFVAWTAGDGYGYGVHAGLYYPDMSSIGPGDVQANETTAGDQGGPGKGPAVASDFYGSRYVVVWGSEESGGHGTYARLFASDGQPSGPEFRVNTRPTLALNSPSVEMAHNGDFVVAWNGSTADGGYAIFARRFDGTGTPLGDEFQVNATQPEAWYEDPDVAIDADGDFVVIWEMKTQPNGPTSVRAQRYAADGTPVGAEIVVTDGSLHVSSSAVAMDWDGDFAVVWASSDEVEPLTVYATRYGADGSASGTASRVNVGPVAEPGTVDIAMDADGDFAVAYESSPAGGTGPDVAIRRFQGNASIDLALDLADIPDPVEGSSYTYGITVTNNNPPTNDEGVDYATGITVQLDLPPGASVAWTSDDPWDCQGSGPLVCIYADALYPGGVANLAVDVRKPPGAGTLQATAWLLADQADPVEENNSDSELTTVTATRDVSPDPFVFEDRYGVERNTVQLSNVITISGINDVAPIWITDGEYSIDGGPFTSASGTISNGQTLQVRHTSSAQFGGYVGTAVMVGETTGPSDLYGETFSTETMQRDVTPDPFVFEDRYDVERSTMQLSNVVTISGINDAAPIQIYEAGEYSIDGGPFTSAPGTISNGQTLQVRHVSSTQFATSVGTGISIGESLYYNPNEIFTEWFYTGTVQRDVTPDPFVFEDRYDVERSTMQLSNVVTISGINDAAPIQIYEAGEYSIDGGPFTSAPGTIGNGQTLQVRHVSSTQFATSVGTGISIGESLYYNPNEIFTEWFYTGTIARDVTPDPFVLEDRYDVERNTMQLSNVVTISGINDAAPIQIHDAGEYSIDGGPFTSAPGTIGNGQTLQVRHVSSEQFATSVGTGISIGESLYYNPNEIFTEWFYTGTVQRDVTPDAFVLEDRYGVERSTMQLSNIVTITGINDAAPIVLSEDGEYSIDGGPFTSAPGTISNGQTLQVRHVSSAQFGTEIRTAISVGENVYYAPGEIFTEWFYTGTVQRDATPDAFVLEDRYDVERSTMQLSNIVTITGINDAAIIMVYNGEYSIDGGAFRTQGSTITSGQSVRVRHVSSSQYGTAVHTTLTVGDTNEVFSSTTLAADVTPDAFAFAPRTGVPMSTSVVSDAIIVTGVNDRAWLSVAGGERSIDGGAFSPYGAYVTAGQSIQVRHVSSSAYSASVTTTLTIGGVTGTFTSTTEASDASPTPFAFVDLADVALDTVVTSTAISIAGINDDAPISVANGAYSIDGGPFTTVPGAILNGQTVRVQHVSAATYAADVHTILTIGDVSDTFTSTTVTDTVPDAFVFTDQRDVARGALVTSDAVTITGLGAPAPVAVSGGEYSIDGATFTGANGTVQSGQTVRVRHTASAAFGASVTTTLTVGGVADSFVSTTIARDLTPDPYGFTDLTGVERGVTLVSDAVTITGINDMVAVRIFGGEYSIDGGAFTTADGTLVEGQTLRVRHTSASTFSTHTDTAVQVGTGSLAHFKSTTLARDVAPDPFGFAASTGVERSAIVESDPVTIVGINDAAPIAIGAGNGGDEYSIDGGPFTSASGTISNGQTVRVRHLSASSFSSNRFTTLVIGTVDGTFQSTTLARDVAPDSFSFASRADVSPATTQTSDPATITGMNDAAQIYVSGGEYSVDGAAFTTALGTIVSGQSVRVRHVSSASFGTTVSTVLTVGGVSDTFSSTTVAADTQPDPFAFADQSGVARSALITSSAIIVGGIDDATPISVAGGSYSINGGAFTSAPGTVLAGHSVRVQHTAAATFSTSVDTVLTIGGVADTFTSTTLAQDTTPTAFAFADQTDVPLDTVVTSAAAVISGVNDDAPVTVVNGTYSVAGAAFTGAPGTIRDGQTLQLRHTSSSSHATAVETTVTVGGVSAAFRSTTVSDTVPDAFTFADQSDVARSATVTSDSVTVGGIGAATPIGVSGGTYSIDGSGFTAGSGMVQNGQSVRVRHVSSSEFGSSVATVLTIGGVSDTFTSTTVARDTAPDPFAFQDVSSVTRSAVVTSSEAVITGINDAAPIGVTGGFYSIDGGAFTSAAGTITAGQKVRVQHTSSASFAASVNTVLTVGDVSDTFTSTTEGRDATPDPFAFQDASNVARSTVVTSNELAITGINDAVSIGVTGGSYSIDGGAFTSAASTITAGQKVRVQHTSSASFAASVSTVLTVGGVSDTFTSTTEARDTAPDPFTFQDQAGVERSTTIASNEVVVSGINDATPISIAGGKYSIDGGPFKSTAGTISNGQRVAVRHTSSASFAASVNTVLTIGGVSDTFTSTTLPADTTPDAFSFASQTGVALNTAITSGSTTVGGINAAAPISVVGGEYSIDGGAFTASAGTVSGGQAVRGRHTSSSAFVTTVTTTLTIGGVSGTFASTTAAEDTTPDAFTFADRTQVAPMTEITSAPVTITGINSAAPIMVSGADGTYSINGGAFTSGAGTVRAGDSVTLRVTSSTVPRQAVTVTVTIGGVSDTWSVKTLP